MYLAPVVITLLGVAAALSWGWADYLATKAARKYSPEATFLWGALVSTILYSIFFLFDRGSMSWNSPGIIYSAVGGAFFAIGYMTYYRGLTIGPVSIVSPVGSAYPLITLVFVLLVFHSSLSDLDIAGVLVTVLGIVLASEVGSRKKKGSVSSGFRLALITLLFWGIAFALFGRSVHFIGWQKATLVDFWADGIFAWLWIAWVQGTKFKKMIKPASAINPYVVGNELLLLIGWVVFAYGLSRARSTAVITAIAAIYPALTIFLSLKYLGEKKKLIPIIGAVITLAGVVILSA